MRIHTTLTLAEMRKLGQRMPRQMAGVTVHSITQHGSRSRPRAFDVHLSGHSVFGGQYGASGYKAATWDEWGVWLGRLFAADPDARIAKIYEGADEFHAITHDRYRPGQLPAQLCPRHAWSYGYDHTMRCRKCGAELTRREHVAAYRESPLHTRPVLEPRTGLDGQHRWAAVVPAVVPAQSSDTDALLARMNRAIEAAEHSIPETGWSDPYEFHASDLDEVPAS